MPVSIANKMRQILTPEGQVVGELPDLSAEQMISLYRWMVLGRLLSNRMVALQRQGRMGTFGPLDGQEATLVGLAAPLQPKDWLTGSYRELLSYMVKGVPMLSILKYYRGYIDADLPLEARCLPIQIVLATQVLHAVGLAMAIKYEGQPQVAVGVCGDGATSEGDFNEALNFAGVFKAPIVFVVQNNGWAISVPRQKQSAAEYLAHRGVGFGIPGYIVDGNDILAVYQVMADCVARARAGEGPTLIEAITYRLGAHTTADDPKKYRSPAEVETWAERDPITRFHKFLLDRNMLTQAGDEQLHEALTVEIQAVVEALEASTPQDPARLFEVVYAEPTPQLQRQHRELLPYLKPAGDGRPQ